MLKQLTIAIEKKVTLNLPRKTDKPEYVAYTLNGKIMPVIDKFANDTPSIRDYQYIEGLTAGVVEFWITDIPDSEIPALFRPLILELAKEKYNDKY